MSLAESDLFFATCIRSFAAAMLLGFAACGDPDAASDAPVDAGREEDAQVQRAEDVQLDLATDKPAPPAEGGKPEVFSDSGRETPVDVSADTPKLALCLRLKDPQNPDLVYRLSQTVGDAYFMQLLADCRVKGATRPAGGAIALADFRSALYEFNLDLWGCLDSPPTRFGLLSASFQDVSRADAALLIELYLRAATTVLALSTSEVADLRSDLERLAGPVVTNDSADYTFSTCAADAGAEIDARIDAGAEIDVRSVDVDRAEASRDATSEPLPDTTEPTDAQEETMDASADGEGGDDGR